MTRIIIRGVDWGREEFVSYLRERLPQAEWCWDEQRSAYQTFLKSLRMQGGDGAIHMEDDVILTRDFHAKAEAVIRERPDAVIQFFSMRKADVDVGSRWDGKFCMNQCYYLPPRIVPGLLEYGSSWAGIAKDPNGYDTMMCEYFKRIKEKHWIHVPSLVDHREAVSIIDRRRSSKRQSKTFREPWL